MPNALGKGLYGAPRGQGCCPRQYVFDSFQKFRRVKRLRQKVHIGNRHPVISGPFCSNSSGHEQHL
jgi:hypothetical protein